MRLEIWFILKQNSCPAVNLWNQTCYLLLKYNNVTDLIIDISIPKGKNMKEGVRGPKHVQNLIQSVPLHFFCCFFSPSWQCFFFWYHPISISSLCWDGWWSPWVPSRSIKSLFSYTINVLLRTSFIVFCNMDKEFSNLQVFIPFHLTVPSLTHLLPLPFYYKQWEELSILCLDIS